MSGPTNDQPPWSITAWQPVFHEGQEIARVNFGLRRIQILRWVGIMQLTRSLRPLFNRKSQPWPFQIDAERKTVCLEHSTGWALVAATTPVSSRVYA